MQHSLESHVIRKVAWRLIPFLGVLYFFAFLDRVNVGFAALTMNADLGLSSAAYGLGAGIFFIGYVAVRSAEQRAAGALRRAHLDRAHHDQLGRAVGRDGVRAGADELLRRALPARRRRSRFLPRHHLLPHLLVSGGATAPASSRCS